MSVFKRKMANGELTVHYHFCFRVGKNRYRGCTYKTDIKEAEQFEEDYRQEVISLLSKKKESIAAKRKSLARFGEKISSELLGASTLLENVWEIFQKEAPAKMRRIPGKKSWESKKGHWRDFLSFLNDRYPQCDTMRSVTPSIAEEYVSILKTSGKYNKTVTYGGISYENKAVKLSSDTINKYIKNLTQIFRILSTRAGLVENPFADVQKVKNKAAKRDVFEVHELEMITNWLREKRNNPPEDKDEHFNFKVCDAVFTIGINTGMRKGDICLLQWSDIKFNRTAIDRMLLKTGERAFIPMTMPLYTFLKEQEKNRVNEYVMPELADMYKNREESITYRFKKMLNELNIETLKTVEGRSRKISAKDIHSLRHTFCYLHGIQGTDIITLQNMVGHMDKEMTEAYMMHKTEELKREAIDKFSLKPFQAVCLSPLDAMKKELVNQINSCQSEEEIKKIYSQFNPGIGQSGVKFG